MHACRMTRANQERELHVCRFPSSYSPLEFAPISSSSALLGLAALLGLDEAEARTAGALEQELHADDCL
jgi:hypothetical protein